MLESSSPRISLPSLVPVLLVVLVAAAYVPTFAAGFMNYDDPWLIEANPWLGRPAGAAMRAFFVDFSEPTRLALGAEYLPVRDVLVYLEVAAFGRAPGPMHAVSVGLYALAVVVLRDLLRRLLPDGRVADLTTVLFALHPVHVESVAWLAGQKDLLAMLFVLLALSAHARASRWYAAVPFLVLLAMLSKSMSVAVLVLMGAQDFLLARRPSPTTYALTTVALAAAMAAHLRVGDVVHMLAEPAGGSRLTAAMTMGPVWLRYVQHAFRPDLLSIVYDVPDRMSWDLPSVLGWAFVAISFVGSFAWLRAGSRFPLFATLWFFAPLAPVSQVLFPLQNRMADRYLFLSVLAPALIVAALVVRAIDEASRRELRLDSWLRGATVVLVAILFFATLDRSVVFADDVLLFGEATRRTRLSALAPYQLGKAYEARHDIAGAEAAFARAIERARPTRDPIGSRASNNLARSLGRRGRMDLAVPVLQQAMRDFPPNAKVQSNLVRALEQVGRVDEARELGRSAGPSAGSEPR